MRNRVFRGLLDRFRRYPELRTGIVNLRSGTAFRGVVWGRRGPWLVLRNCEVLSERGAPVKRSGVDGEVAVLVSEVDFVQIVG